MTNISRYVMTLLIQIKTFVVSLILICCASMSTADESDHHHDGTHSDDLLYLLQYKIAISKLQQAFSGQSPEEQASNLAQQQTRFNKAMPLLKRYLEEPESRYPNMSIYHQSLQSRGALLADYVELLAHHSEQLQAPSKSTNN